MDVTSTRTRTSDYHTGDIVLPSDARAVRIEPDLDDTDWLAGKFLECVIEFRKDGQLLKRFGDPVPFCLQTGILRGDCIDMPSVQISDSEGRWMPGATVRVSMILYDGELSGATPVRVRTRSLNCAVRIAASDSVDTLPARKTEPARIR